MSVGRKTKKALAVLLPVGVLGISSALATTRTEVPRPANSENALNVTGVAERLRAIRAGVSEMSAAKGDESTVANLLFAEWGNFGFGWRNGGWGWHNGGWHNWHNWGNGGWGNGGWGNGWHNAPNWGNGGWHNWHNFWHNW